MGRSKFKADEKIAAVLEFLDGKNSQLAIAERLGIDRATFQQWIKNYQSMGSDAFQEHVNQSYSKELKEQAVADYLSGRGSLLNLCEKYKIKSTYQLRDWIKKYNGLKELNASGTGGAVIMTKGRKTTFDERVEIVQYCIAHDRNYVETAEKYKVSYQQARSYTVKYEAGGLDALQDRRGRTKPQEEMSEVERLRAENKILRAEIERAEMESSFLKKLNEIERRRG